MPNFPDIFILHTNKTIYYLISQSFVIIHQLVIFDLDHIIRTNLILWSNLDY